MEENIRASIIIQDPIYYEDLHGEEQEDNHYLLDSKQEDNKYRSDLEQQQGCKYISELDKSYVAFADYYMDMYAYQVYD